jgi:hypothetical protein
MSMKKRQHIVKITELTKQLVPKYQVQGYVVYLWGGVVFFVADETIFGVQGI